MKIPQVPSRADLRLARYQFKEALSRQMQYLNLKRLARDTVYLIRDVPMMTRSSHNTYGAFVRYLRQAKKGKVNPDDFKSVDTNALRQVLDTYSKVKGPLTGFDLRFFYYMYAVMFAYLFYTVYKLSSVSGTKKKDSQMTLKERRNLYEGTYEEELRAAPPATSTYSLSPSLTKG